MTTGEERVLGLVVLEYFIFFPTQKKKGILYFFFINLLKQFIFM